MEAILFAATADAEASRQFYVELLGMTEVDRPAFDFQGAWFQIDRAYSRSRRSPFSDRRFWLPRYSRIV